MTETRTRSTGPLDDEAVLVGTRIRRLRRDAGLTMVQLASRARVGQPFLSLVERGHARLSLTTMARVAAALGVRSATLLAQGSVDRDQGHAGVEVVRVAHREPVGDRTLWQLAQVGGISGVEMAGTETTGETTVHDEDEFVYVVAGVLEVVLGDGAVQRLGPGGSVAFAAGTPHRWRAVDAEGYRLVVVTAGTPVGPVDASRSSS